MATEHSEDIDPRLQAALAELQEMIRQRYPEVLFRVGRSPEDPAIVHLVATVNVQDTDEVLDVVVDRMMQMQIDEGLPIFVIPVRPLAQVLEEIRRSRPAIRTCAIGNLDVPY